MLPGKPGPEVVAQDLPQHPIDRFIVCGLGSLGQHTVYNLKRLSDTGDDVHIVGIDVAFPHAWEVKNLLQLLSEPPLLGDSREDEVLLRAQVQQARAILIVTNDETANLETAMAARRLNPQIRLVVRSSKQNLNGLLADQLGNFIAYEPTGLPATAFALAGRRDELMGEFQIGTTRLQVIQRVIGSAGDKFLGRPLGELHHHQRRLISWKPAPGASVENPNAKLLTLCEPSHPLATDETVTLIEIVTPHERAGKSPELNSRRESGWNSIVRTTRGALQEGWSWLSAQTSRLVVLFGLIIAALLWFIGASVLKTAVPDMSWGQSARLAVILMLGGYGDVFGGMTTEIPVPLYVHLVCLFMTGYSLLFVLGVLGLFTEQLLNARLFLWRPPTIPSHDHVIVIGMGRIGLRVTTQLNEWNESFIALSDEAVPLPSWLRRRTIVGDLLRELPRLHLETARSLILVTDDQLFNLELALTARQLAARTGNEVGLVIRGYSQQFTQNVINMVPRAKVMVAYELSGEAFAASAFGENILSLFRLNGVTVLVTEYVVADSDGLSGHLLSQVGSGYGVVPIFHRREVNAVSAEKGTWMPSDDIRLQPGDVVILLASINGLRRIERKVVAPPRRWSLSAEPPRNPGFVHSAGNDLARISGISLEEARRFMSQLPATLDLDLYETQAYSLRQELSRKLSLNLVLRNAD